MFGGRVSLCECVTVSALCHEIVTWCVSDCLVRCAFASSFLSSFSLPLSSLVLSLSFFLFLSLVEVCAFSFLSWSVLRCVVSVAHVTMLDVMLCLLHTLTFALHRLALLCYCASLTDTVVPF